MLFTGLRTVQQTLRGIEESKDRQSPYFCSNVLARQRICPVSFVNAKKGVTKVDQAMTSPLAVHTEVTCETMRG